LKNEELEYGQALFVDEEDKDENIKFIPYKKPSEKLLQYIKDFMK
jgi:hypothetical protein